MAIDSALGNLQPVVFWFSFSTFVEVKFILAEEGWAIWLFDNTNHVSVFFDSDLGSAEGDVETLSNREGSNESVCIVTYWVGEGSIIGSKGWCNALLTM